MAWKMATSFVLTAETWLGADGEDALLIIGVSRNERLAVLERIKSGDDVSFSEPMWLARHHVDDRYFAMLSRGQNGNFGRGVFGKNGELPAQRLN